MHGTDLSYPTEFPLFAHHGSAFTLARRYITNKDRAKLQQYITRNLEISREICHCLWSEISRKDGPSTRPVHLRHLTVANDKSSRGHRRSFACFIKVFLSVSLLG